MNRPNTLLLLLIMIAALAAAGSASLAQAGAKPAGGDSAALQAILGDWRGSSLCLVKPSACHDEEALYHIKPAAEQSAKLVMQLDKIVDGKPEMMGTADCSYDGQKNLLHCEFGRGFLDLTLQANHLDGAMFLTDKTRWRDIKLVKVKP